MGKQVSVVTGSMSLYSTRPNVRLGSSSSFASGYLLNRALVVTNRQSVNIKGLTINKSTGLMKNGFINKVGNYQYVTANSIKSIKLN